jgi:hypothetical protein
MSTPIPEGFVLEEVDAVPPEVRLASQKMTAWTWLKERVLAMPIGGTYQVTTPNRKKADSARATVNKLSKQFGPILKPQRRWQVYLSAIAGKENYRVFVECWPVETMASAVAAVALAVEDDLPELPAVQNGDAPATVTIAATGVTYTNQATGKVYTRVEMKELLRNKRVQPLERFIHSQRGLQEVVRQGDALVMRAARD